MKPDSPILAWLDRNVVEPLDFKRPLPRVFGLTIGYRRSEDGEWGAQLSPPARRGDWLWRNGLFSFFLHLPFGMSLSVRLPIKFRRELRGCEQPGEPRNALKDAVNGYWWGWTLQAMIGWKSYNGRPSLILRVQNDDHPEFNNPGGPSGRARGLDEGNV